MKEKKKITYDIVIANIIRVIMIICSFRQLRLKKYMDAFNALLCVVITFIPGIISKKIVKLPKLLQVVMMLFAFMSMYFGEIHRGYGLVPGFDKFLHTLSGVVLGIIGFLLAYELTENKDENVKISPFFACLFAFMFAVTLGAIWEIYEYTCDTLFNWNMQNWKGTGVVDTMQDIIVDTLGALVTSIGGYFYLKKKEEVCCLEAVKENI